MKNIECPFQNGDANLCNWKYRKGSVRDFPQMRIQECVQCGIVTHENDLSQLVNYSEGSMYLWAAGYGGNLESSFSDISRRVEQIKLLNQKYSIETICDFGCGVGEMVAELSKTFNTFGIEPETEAREKLQTNGFQIFENLWNSKLSIGNNFSLVTMFHVIEHIYNPKSELNLVYESLEEGGLLIIETPSAQDALLTLYDNNDFANFTYWSHHPILYSLTAIEKIVCSAGFKIIDLKNVQRYGLANHLYWLSHGKPNGHQIWDKFFPAELTTIYDQFLAAHELGDTIWLLAQK